jgi:hypothetical protein
MNLSRVICAMLIAISVAGLFAELSEAQVQMQPPGWTPKGVEVLRSTASSRTEFTLDHSMLVLASKLDANNDDLRRVIAGVSGVFVHDYRYAKPWVYDADILDSLKEEYRAAGWKQLMNSRDKIWRNRSLGAPREQCDQQCRDSGCEIERSRIFCGEWVDQSA